MEQSIYLNNPLTIDHLKMNITEYLETLLAWLLGRGLQFMLTEGSASPQTIGTEQFFGWKQLARCPPIHPSDEVETCLLYTSRCV